MTIVSVKRQTDIFTVYDMTHDVWIHLYYIDRYIELGNRVCPHVLCNAFVYGLEYSAHTSPLHGQN